MQVKTNEIEQIKALIREGDVSKALTIAESVAGKITHTNIIINLKKEYSILEKDKLHNTISNTDYYLHSSQITRKLLEICDLIDGNEENVHEKAKYGSKNPFIFFSQFSYKELIWVGIVIGVIITLIKFLTNLIT